MNPLHAASTVVLLLVTAGLMFRRRRGVHYALMVSAFALDLMIVVWIEATRGAVERVVARPNPALLYFHVAVSLAVIGLYAGQLRLGFRALRGAPMRVALHRRLGTAFVLFRLANYATSYLVTPASDKDHYAIREAPAAEARR
ncbi:MAG: hypothetical protein AB7L66_18285 [Gemmatimonadales bacterium]